MINVIFDLGSVLLEWEPRAVLNAFFGDIRLADEVYGHVFGHPDWIAMDRGTLEEERAVAIFSQRTRLSASVVQDMLLHVRNSLVPMAVGMELLRWSVERGLPVFCLSNMPIQTYELIRPKFSFFDWFSDVAISGYIKAIKPEPAIYRYALEKFKLEPQTTVLIDDRVENVNAAVELGMSGFVFDGSDACSKRIREWLEARACSSLGGP